MDILLIHKGHPYWDRTIEFARASSWRAGPFLARRMEANDFQDWERVAVAVELDRVVGYCTFTEKDALPDGYGFAPFIGFVFVDERHRGSRVSQRMIERALQYAKSLGYPSVYLMSDERGLYEKYGFEKLGDYPTIHGAVEQLFRKGL